MINPYISQLQNLLREAKLTFEQYGEEEWRKKPDPEKWSRIEIVGHLIDSAIHNYIRYNELEFESIPYKMRPYQQDALVKSNKYQDAHIVDLLVLLFSLNKRILVKYGQFSDEFLKTEVVLPDGTPANLWLMVDDYVNHFQKHFHQIKNL